MTATASAPLRVRPFAVAGLCVFVAALAWAAVGVPHSWAGAWTKAGVWAALALLALPFAARSARVPGQIAGALSTCFVFLAVAALVHTQHTGFGVQPGGPFGQISYMLKQPSLRDVLPPLLDPALAAGCYGFAAAARWPRRAAAETAIVILGVAALLIVLVALGR